ncbi:L-threonine O-3-phosphate decarboxylase [Rhodovulum bhavnagarense]|uniref:threonine-phosphate decarboxylase n=1 Tax=Rhodovulum bhavnagarense TaxID=992286 RepID=A0A4R2RGV5_9RHOB|nr:threonine-phosphate decarboxylase CobD [Rhodovulum bhavnagarense]TCP61649.1 L-threonine O-3-phosphate decarboxylase [Rhodovulum bhavnagarense]
MRRDHGGDLAMAIQTFGGQPDEWIDLSTGINRVPYPVASLPAEAWAALPGRIAHDRLVAAARMAYGTGWSILPLAGAQAAIQLLPTLGIEGPVRIVIPTYNEYAGVLAAAGHAVQPVTHLDALEGAAMAIVVNPNNPDGRRTDPARLTQIARQVDLLIVDESFADPHPELSMLGGDCPGNVIVLRSFGKFYGLAGMRLGFALGAQASLERMRERAGPWAVSGPALEIGARALSDPGWRATSIGRLAAETARADALAAGAGWHLVGGTALFRLYDTPDARAAQARLARDRIWSRVFPGADRWLRLGLPGCREEWQRLAAALR